LAKSRIDRAVEDFIAIPMVALLGIYIVSALIDSMLGINNETFKIVFTAIGGIPFIAYYFKKKIKQYMD